MMISFGDKLTDDIFNGNSTSKTRKFDTNLVKRTIRKLDMIEFATSLNDLRIPPSNFLEKLEGNLKDSYSIRINDQYRIIFKWIDGNAHEVQIIDYH